MPARPRQRTRTQRRRGPGRRRARRSRIRRLRQRLRRWLPSRAARRRAWRRFRRSPAAFQIACGGTALLLLAAASNALVQVARKPTELFFPVSGALYKTPAEIWDAYEPIFRRHSTAVISAEFLAALAQVESSGNPLVRTYWRWSWTTSPFELYRPASSAVGMYQITDGTFEEARRHCIHDHRVVADGPWYDFRSCWFNALYQRVIPSHAVELTAAYLQHRVDGILERQRIRGASLAQQQQLAAVIHLCGASAGARHAQRGLRLLPAQRCGDHRVDAYLVRLESARRRFAQLARAGEARAAMQAAGSALRGPAGRKHPGYGPRAAPAA